MNREEQEFIYNELVKLYDLAENMLDTIDFEGVSQPELRLELSEPVIRCTNECADVLTSTFMDIVKRNGKPTKKEVKEVESAIRKNFASILTFTRKVEGLPRK